MKKFTPRGKLSKKERRRLDGLRRRTWGTLRPATRVRENPKAYDRKRNRGEDEL